MGPIDTTADVPLPHAGASVRLEVGPEVSLRVIVRAGRTAPDFLLVHGLASNARLWDDVAGELARHGHASVSVDQRGHGLSDKPDRGYDFATLTADLERVSLEVATPPVIVVGQSWGGNVVLEFAARYPDLVAAVCLVDGGFIRLAASFPSWPAARSALTPPPLRGLPLEEIERAVRTGMATFPENGIRAQLANFEVHEDGTISPRLDVANHLAILEELWRHDPDDVVQHIDVPILVIATHHGMAGKAERVAAFAEAGTDVSVTWLDAHHDAHAERPGIVAELVLGLVDRLGEAR